MKSRVCLNPLAVPFQNDPRSHTFSGAIHRLDGTRARRQRRLLLGMSILLILGWTIGSVWLITVRRGERSSAEVGERHETIAVLLPAEMGIDR